MRSVRIVLARDHRQVALHPVLEPTFPVDHLRILARSHPIDDRHRVHPHERLEGRIEDIPVHVIPVGVRTVEHHHLFAVLCAGLHHVREGRNVGIETATHVLNIVDEHIHILERLGGRFVFSRAIERNHRDTRLLVHLVGYFGPGSRLTPETVLRCENLDDVHPFGQQVIHHVLPVSHHGSMVAHESHPFSLEQFQIQGRLLRPHFDGLFRLGRFLRRNRYESTQKCGKAQCFEQCFHAIKCCSYGLIH